MTTIRVAFTTLIEVDVEAWVAESDNHGYVGVTPEEVADAVGLYFNLTDRVPRWARDAVLVLVDGSNHAGTSFDDSLRIVHRR